MKKSLIALAALATVASAAQAQNVTMYGRIDQGYRFSEVTESRGRVNETANINGGGWTSSRLGINVSEDLGGGLRAFGTWESNLTVIDSSASPSATAASSLGTIRQAFAGIQGKFGRLSIGNQYLPEYFQGITHLAGTVNAGTGYGAADLASPTATSAVGTGMRRGELTQSNNIQYVFPKFGDITVTGVYGSSMQDRTNSAGTAQDTDTEAKLMSLSANYAKGPLTATLSFSQLDRKNLVAASQTATIVGATSECAGTGFEISANLHTVTGQTAYACTFTQQARDIKQKNWTASGIYDFGAVKAFAYYADREQTGTTVIDYRTYNVGVQVPMGKIVPFAMIGEGKQKSGTGVEVSKPEFYQVGATYNFSKRTLGYAYFNSYKDNVVTSGPNVKKAENTTFGVVHQF